MARFPVGTRVRVSPTADLSNNWTGLPCVVIEPTDSEFDALGVDLADRRRSMTWVRPLAHRPDGHGRGLFTLSEESFVLDAGPIPDLSDRTAVESWLDEPQREDA